MDQQTIVILNFGGRYRDTIARRVRELSVYSEILPVETHADKIRKMNPIGIILVGGGKSILDSDIVFPEKSLYKSGIPILGIGLGAQLMAAQLGGTVIPLDSPGSAADIRVDASSPLFSNLDEVQPVYFDHVARIEKLPDGFRSTASMQDLNVAAFENDAAKLYGTQFFLEAEETASGRRMLERFLFGICGAEGSFTIDDYLNNQIKSIKHTVGKERILLALSGGLDSSVVAAILSAAVPNQLTCVFVDHGLMRKGEGDEIEAAFQGKSLKLVRVDASERFFKKLSGVVDPEKKRKIIGEQFIKVFSKQAQRVGGAKFLAQGTIYPDVIESGIGKNNLIKSHHNVGGLPKELGFKDLVEPLRYLFKDEVRQLGRLMGLPSSIVNRQPFPGPGLAIRILGDVTRAKAELLREADAIFREELADADLRPSQFFAVLSDHRSVGVEKGARTYHHTVILRAVQTMDFMKASYVPLPDEVLRRVSRRITSEVAGVNRVVYDVTDKPPATIEWE